MSASFIRSPSGLSSYSSAASITQNDRGPVPRLARNARLFDPVFLAASLSCLSGASDAPLTKHSGFGVGRLRRVPHRPRVAPKPGISAPRPIASHRMTPGPPSLTQISPPRICHASVPRDVSRAGRRNDRPQPPAPPSPARQSGTPLQSERPSNLRSSRIGGGIEPLARNSRRPARSGLPRDGRSCSTRRDEPSARC